MTNRYANELNIQEKAYMMDQNSRERIPEYTSMFETRKNDLLNA